FGFGSEEAFVGCIVMKANKDISNILLLYGIYDAVAYVHVVPGERDQGILCSGGVHQSFLHYLLSTVLSAFLCILIVGDVEGVYGDCALPGLEHDAQIDQFCDGFRICEGDEYLLVVMTCGVFLWLFI